MSRLRFFAFLLVLLVPHSARADDGGARAAAREHFRRGVEAVGRDDLSLAVEEFQAAYALSPEPVVLYNLGLTQHALGHAVEAVQALRAYREASAEDDPARLQEVDALISADERRTGELELVLAPASAALEVDGVPRELVAGKLALAAGSHVLVARAVGHAPAIVNVLVVPQAATRAEIRLAPLPLPENGPAHTSFSEPAPAPLPPPASSDRGAHIPIVSAVSGALGLAALGVGTALAISASELEREARRGGHCNSRDCDPVGFPLRQKAHTQAAVAAGVFVGAGVLLAASVTLYFAL